MEEREDEEKSRGWGIHKSVQSHYAGMLEGGFLTGTPNKKGQRWAWVVHLSSRTLPRSSPTKIIHHCQLNLLWPAAVINLPHQFGPETGCVLVSMSADTSVSPFKAAAVTFHSHVS